MLLQEVFEIAPRVVADRTEVAGMVTEATVAAQKVAAEKMQDLTTSTAALGATRSDGIGATTMESEAAMALAVRVESEAAMALAV